MPLIHYTCHVYTGLCEWIQKKIYLYFLFVAKNIRVRFVEVYVKYSNGQYKDRIFYLKKKVHDISKHLFFLIIYLYKLKYKFLNINNSDQFFIIKYFVILSRSDSRSRHCSFYPCQSKIFISFVL